MSYVVHIGEECFNYTYNVSKLFYNHMEGGIKVIDGMTGKQAARHIGPAFDRMSATIHRLHVEGAIGEPAFCAEYDPKNGWGSTIGGMIFLGMILNACIKRPRSKVRVS